MKIAKLKKSVNGIVVVVTGLKPIIHSSKQKKIGIYASFILMLSNLQGFTYIV